MQNVDELLILLRGVKPSGDHKWMALCPAHNDKKRSLSITEVKDRILVNCLATCSIEQVLEALNLTKADLFFNAGRPKLEQRQIEIIYHYTDANGKPFEVVRTRPKGFYQRRPDGEGGYINNLRGIVPTLYHTDKLGQAIDANSPIYFVEGEKDADRLWSLGLPATTNPMGAGKWRDSYAEALCDADLVIIPDNDKPGRDHAHQVAKSLHGTASRVRILEIPSQYRDVSDWLDNGGTVEQMRQLLEQCPDYEPPQEPQGEVSAALGTGPFNLTDLGNAERLRQQYGDALRYCYERKRWLVWTSKVWEWDLGAKVVALAKLAVRNIYHEAGDEPDEKRRKEIADHARRSESDHKITAMLDLVQSEPGIPVRPTELDTNPWLFNCLNGTVDLKTGQLLPHRKEDMLTVLVPVEYDPEAQCPLWSKFLHRVSDDNGDLTGYLQRAIGYSLTGDTKNQVLFFLYGLGNNGKSTFITTIRKLMGEYGGRVTSDLFMLRDRNAGGPKEALANLRGKRYVAASELEDGRRLAVTLIKDMTGGETIRADRKYEHEIEYQPTHKLWLVGNHKPVIADSTLSIWRRMRLVPFTVTIPDKEIDLDLPAKLEAELPGILAWAVQGCLEWQRQGLSEPDAVVTATASYRHEQDILGDFLEDCCALESLAAIAKSELKEAYHTWCGENGADPVTQRTFRFRLMEKGIGEGRIEAARLWRGIRLRTEEDGDINDKTQGNVSDLASKMTRMTRLTSNTIKLLHEGNTRKVYGKSCHEMSSSFKKGEKAEKMSLKRTGGNIPPYPTEPCPACGGDYYLSKDNQWLCVRCHPEPEEKEEV